MLTRPLLPAMAANRFFSISGEKVPTNNVLISAKLQHESLKEPWAIRIWLDQQAAFILIVVNLNP